MSSCTTLPLTRDTFYLFSPPEENSVKIKIVLGKALIPCPRTIANIPESAIKPTHSLVGHGVTITVSNYLSKHLQEHSRSPDQIDNTPVFEIIRD